MRFDALLLLSFGGPDGPDDVRPFLANVLHGRPVPPERVEQVVGNYMLFGGRSPINDQNRSLLEALRARTDRPVYWGNRNWHPYLADTLASMRDDGIGRAAVFTTSAYSSYSGCRQYIEDMERARAAVGPGAPELVKLRPFFDHPGFYGPLTEGLARAVADAGPDAPVLMSAHSIPESMAATCDYQVQLAATAERVATGAGVSPGRWRQVYQSRSGSPAQPWLGPDVRDAIADLPAGTDAVVVTPLGFVSDHMEVIYDLDTAAAEAARERGMRFVRSATPGSHPAFADMVVGLLTDLEDAGGVTSWCRPGCCPPPRRQPTGPVDSGR